MRRLASVALVCVGLLFFVQSIGLLSFPMAFFLPGALSESRSQAGLALAVSFVPAVIALGLAVMLVLGHERLAARWFEDAPLDLPLDAVSLLRVGLIVTGVVLLAQVAISLGGSIAVIAQLVSMSFPGGRSAALVTVLPSLGARVVGLLLGAALLLWSRPLASRLWREPGAPTPPPALPACPQCGASYDPLDYRQGAEARCSQCGARLQPGV